MHDGAHQRVTEDQHVLVELANFELPGIEKHESHGYCFGCQRHHEPVDLDGLIVTYDGGKYAPRPAVEASVCPSCFREHRETEQTTHRRFVATQVTREDKWHIVGDFFDSLTPRLMYADGYIRHPGLPLVACPWCGSPLEKDQVTRAGQYAVACPKHGEFTLHVSQEDETEG